MTSSVVRAELALLVKKIVSGFLVAIPVFAALSSISSSLKTRTISELVSKTGKA
jgi:hypothetical protein